MKIIQYMNSNATMLVQYGFSKTGFGNVLRYAITLIVTTTEIIARIIFRNLPFSILFHLLLFYFNNNLYAANTTRKIIANPTEIFGSSIAENNTKKAAKMAIIPSVLLLMSILYSSPFISFYSSVSKPIAYNGLWTYEAWLLLDLCRVRLFICFIRNDHNKCSRRRSMLIAYLSLQSSFFQQIPFSLPEVPELSRQRPKL